MLNGYVTQDMTSMFTMRDGSEFYMKVNVRRNYVSEKVCFLEFGSCVVSPLVNALDGDVLCSRSGLSDLHTVQIEAKLLLHDNDSHSDDLEALTIIFGY